mgnify:FL=1
MSDKNYYSAITGANTGRGKVASIIIDITISVIYGIIAGIAVLVIL